VPAWPLAVASLPVAFAVADASGVRPLGGLVLVVLAGAAVLAGHRHPGRSAGWLALLLACFAASHALADTAGTWGAVAIVTVVAGVAGVALLDRQGPSTAAVHQG
jgi:hypothetical protein